jgi:hypothetical protein
MEMKSPVRISPDGAKVLISCRSQPGLLWRHAEELAGIGAFDFHTHGQTGDVHQLVFRSKRTVHETWTSGDGGAIRQIGCRSRSRLSYGGSAWRSLGHGSHVAVRSHGCGVRTLRSCRGLWTICCDVGRGGCHTARNQEGTLGVWADDFGAGGHSAHIHEAWRIGERCAHITRQVWHCLRNGHRGRIQHRRWRCCWTVRTHDRAWRLHWRRALRQHARSIGGSQWTAFLAHIIGDEPTSLNLLPCLARRNGTRCHHKRRKAGCDETNRGMGCLGHRLSERLIFELAFSF